MKGQRLPSKTKGFSIKKKTKDFHLPSKKEQLRLLKKKGINIGRARTTWSVYRLYNYYVTQRHPKSSPRYLAYGTGKQFERRIETAKEPEKITVRTGTGKKLFLSNIIKKEKKTLDKQTIKILMPNMSTTLNKRCVTNKALDVIHIDVGMVINENTYTEDVKELKDYIEKTIMPIVKKMLSIRKPFYDRGEHVIGAKINFESLQGMKTYEMEYDDKYHRRVKVTPEKKVIITEFHTTVAYRGTYRGLEELEADIKESIEMGAHKVFDYNNLTLLLTSIEVGVITRVTMNRIEALRV